MSPKTAITILSLIFVLSIFTILVLVLNRDSNQSDINTKNNASSNENYSQESREEKELENEFSDYEKLQEEALLRLENLNTLRESIEGDGINTETPYQESDELEQAAKERLDKLNELREDLGDEVILDNQQILTDEEEIRLEEEARLRLERLNELRNQVENQ